jgi:hypothetical protein
MSENRHPQARQNGHQLLVGINPQQFWAGDQAPFCLWPCPGQTEKSVAFNLPTLIPQSIRKKREAKKNYIGKIVTKLS